MGRQGGKPLTFNWDLSQDGAEYGLRCNTAELFFRPRTSAEARIYWNEDDFNDDTNYVEINGDASSGDLRMDVGVSTIWIRGTGTLEVTAITSIG